MATVAILSRFHQVAMPDPVKDNIALYYLFSVFLIVSKLLPSFACSHLAPTARTNKYLQQIQAKRTTGDVKSDHLLMLNRQRINDLYVV